MKLFFMINLKKFGLIQFTGEGEVIYHMYVGVSEEGHYLNNHCEDGELYFSNFYYTTFYGQGSGCCARYFTRID